MRSCKFQLFFGIGIAIFRDISKKQKQNLTEEDVDAPTTSEMDTDGESTIIQKNSALVAPSGTVATTTATPMEQSDTSDASAPALAADPSVNQIGQSSSDEAKAQQAQSNLDQM